MANENKNKKYKVIVRRAKDAKNKRLDEGANGNHPGVVVKPTYLDVLHAPVYSEPNYDVPYKPFEHPIYGPYSLEQLVQGNAYVTPSNVTRAIMDKIPEDDYTSKPLYLLQKKYEAEQREKAREDIAIRNAVIQKNAEQTALIRNLQNAARLLRRSAAHSGRLPFSFTEGSSDMPVVLTFPRENKRATLDVANRSFTMPDFDVSVSVPDNSVSSTEYPDRVKFGDEFYNLLYSILPGIAARYNKNLLPVGVEDVSFEPEKHRAERHYTYYGKNGPNNSGEYVMGTGETVRPQNDAAWYGGKSPYTRSVLDWTRLDPVNQSGRITNMLYSGDFNQLLAPYLKYEDVTGEGLPSDLWIPWAVKGDNAENGYKFMPVPRILPLSSFNFNSEMFKKDPARAWRAINDFDSLMHMLTTGVSDRAPVYANYHGAPVLKISESKRVGDSIDYEPIDYGQEALKIANIPGYFENLIGEGGSYPFKTSPERVALEKAKRHKKEDRQAYNKAKALYKEIQRNKEQAADVAEREANATSKMRESKNNYTSNFVGTAGNYMKTNKQATYMRAAVHNAIRDFGDEFGIGTDEENAVKIFATQSANRQKLNILFNNVVTDDMSPEDAKAEISRTILRAYLYAKENGDLPKEQHTPAQQDRQAQSAKDKRDQRTKDIMARARERIAKLEKEKENTEEEQTVQSIISSIKEPFNEYKEEKQEEL